MVMMGWEGVDDAGIVHGSCVVGMLEFSLLCRR